MFVCLLVAVAVAVAVVVVVVVDVVVAIVATVVVVAVVHELIIIVSCLWLYLPYQSSGCTHHWCHQVKQSWQKPN